MRALWSDRQICSHNMSQKVKRIKRVSDKNSQSQSLRFQIANSKSQLSPQVPQKNRTTIAAFRSIANSKSQLSPQVPQKNCSTIAAFRSRKFQIAVFFFACETVRTSRRCPTFQKPKSMRFFGGAISNRNVFGTLSRPFPAFFTLALPLQASSGGSKEHLPCKP